ncbi:hypothetical protein AB6A40_007442 [Gnathostoma spinigerum]|uniref:Uncharacterized protein n=1 Tax=Gnathostoma spinigerum TaxID=75299 RepID=A0ABD6ELI3_9BILA
MASSLRLDSKVADDERYSKDEVSRMTNQILTQYRNTNEQRKRDLFSAIVTAIAEHQPLHMAGVNFNVALSTLYKYHRQCLAELRNQHSRRSIDPFLNSQPSEAWRQRVVNAATQLLKRKRRHSVPSACPPAADEPSHSADLNPKVFSSDLIAKCSEKMGEPLNGENEFRLTPDFAEFTKENRKRKCHWSSDIAKNGKHDKDEVKPSKWSLQMDEAWSSWTKDNAVSLAIDEVIGLSLLPPHIKKGIRLFLSMAFYTGKDLESFTNEDYKKYFLLRETAKTYLDTLLFILRCRTGHDPEYFGRGKKPTIRIRKRRAVTLEPNELTINVNVANLKRSLPGLQASGSSEDAKSESEIPPSKSA